LFVFINFALLTVTAKKSICFHSRSNHGVDFPMYLCGRGHLGHYIRWFVSEIFALVTFIPKLSVGALILWDQDSALMANFRTQSSVNLLRWYFFNTLFFPEPARIAYKLTTALTQQPWIMLRCSYVLLAAALICNNNGLAMPIQLFSDFGTQFLVF